jgi:hypothetical protein
VLLIAVLCCATALWAARGRLTGAVADLIEGEDVADARRAREAKEGEHMGKVHVFFKPYGGQTVGQEAWTSQRNYEVYRAQGLLDLKRTSAEGGSAPR